MYVLDLCVSSLRRGHANILCIVPILSYETAFTPLNGNNTTVLNFSYNILVMGIECCCIYLFLTKKILLICQKRLEEIVGVGGKTPAKLRRHGENPPKSEYRTY